jgi:hypothetical protein
MICNRINLCFVLFLKAINSSAFNSIRNRKGSMGRKEKEVKKDKYEGRNEKGEIETDYREGRNGR